MHAALCPVWSYLWDLSDGPVVICRAHHVYACKLININLGQSAGEYDFHIEDALFARFSRKHTPQVHNCQADRLLAHMTLIQLPGPCDAFLTNYIDFIKPH